MFVHSVAIAGWLKTATLPVWSAGYLIKIKLTCSKNSLGQKSISLLLLFYLNCLDLVFLKAVLGSVHGTADALTSQGQVKDPDEGHDCQDHIGQDEAEHNIGVVFGEEGVDGAVEVAA